MLLTIIVCLFGFGFYVLYISGFWLSWMQKNDTPGCGEGLPMAERKKGMQGRQLCNLLFHLSSDQTPNYLLYIGDYTTLLYRDDTKPLFI